MMRFLFSFDGRIRRSHYWLGVIGVDILLWAVVFFVAGFFGVDAAISHSAGGAAGGALLGGLIIVAAMVAGVWAGLALQVKRWHDRDKTWAWVFIVLLPVIGWIWALVEIGFADGTPGPNRFGPSPKGIGAAQPAAAAAT